MGKILAGKVRFYVLEIVHCLLLRCPWSTLPTVCYHLVLCPWVFCQSYFAHRILPVCTSHASVLPFVARYILANYWLAKYHMQSTNVQSTTGKLPVGKRHYGQRTSWQGPSGLNTTGKWMLGKVLRGQCDWQANYDRPWKIAEFWISKIGKLQNSGFRKLVNFRISDFKNLKITKFKFWRFWHKKNLEKKFEKLCFYSKNKLDFR